MQLFTEIIAGSEEQTKPLNFFGKTPFFNFFFILWEKEKEYGLMFGLQHETRKAI